MYTISTPGSASEPVILPRFLTLVLFLISTVASSAQAVYSTKPQETPEEVAELLATQGTWTIVPGGLTSLSVGSEGPWGINNTGNIFRYRNNSWEMVPGGAVTVSAGPSGDAWVVNAGGQIWRWNATKNNWDNIPGGLVGISAGPDVVWGVNAGNQIWRYLNGRWEQMPGSATAVSVGPRGDVWALGTREVAGGKNILSWDPSTNSWTAVDGGLVQISAGVDGLWGVNDGNVIRRRVRGLWTVVEGSASAVAVGPTGEFWALGTGSVEGGRPVMKRQ